MNRVHLNALVGPVQGDVLGERADGPLGRVVSRRGAEAAAAAINDVLDDLRPGVSWTSVTRTAAPSLASRLAIALPIPLAAPVTSATRPCSRSTAALLPPYREMP